MADPLDDLLHSCSLASRSIRLLTAEAKRRATLLRLCCGDYERAIDRLEELEALKEGQLDSAGQPRPESASPDFVQLRGGRNSAANFHRESAGSSGSTPSSVARPRFSDPDAVDTTVDPAVESERGASQDRGDDIGYPAAFEASSITESLEKILEQARSIRTRQAAPCRPKGPTAERASRTAPGDSATIAPPRQKKGVPASSGSRGEVACARVTGSTGRQGHDAKNARTPPPTLHPGRSARPSVGIKSSAYGQTKVRSKHSDGRRAGAAGASPTYVSERDAVRAGAVRRRPTTPVDADHRDPYSPICGGSEYVEASDPVGFERGQSEMQASAPESVGYLARDISDLRDAMREEIARYGAARARLMGRSGGHADAGKVSRPNDILEVEEEALLCAFNSETPRDAGAAVAASLKAPPRPVPEYIAWQQLLRGEPSEREGNIGNYFDGKHGADCRRGVDLMPCGGGGILRRRGGGKQVERGDWADVERLQRSVMMLLDEVEGKRELAVHEARARSRGDKTTRGWGVAKDGSGEVSEVDPALLAEFEEWYSWNKIVHVAGLLRGRVDELNAGDGADEASLSKDAAALIRNPSHVLAGENPLRASLGESDVHHWRGVWQKSDETRELDGTACFALVKKLQLDTPSCCPLESCWPQASSRSESEAFGRQLRTRSLLAAESDMSQFVLPTLERTLSHACRKARAVDLRSNPLKDEQDPVTPAPARKSERGDLGVLEELRERVAMPAVGSRCCEEEGDREGEALWAPALAVFRAVDAVLSGGGQPRVSFVRRRGVRCAAGL